MKEFLTEEFNISSFDLTPGGKARLTSLANFFQEIAYHHTARLGVVANEDQDPQISRVG